MASEPSSFSDVPLLRTCSSLADYLKTLRADQVSGLFRHPATCLALMRELPPLAQNFVMRLLFVEQSVPQAVVASWVKSDNRQAEQEASKILAGLGVWAQETAQGGMPAWRVDAHFKHNLRAALLGG